MKGNPVGIAIETSGSVGTVALDDVNPPRVIRFSEGLSHGKLLLPSVEGLLKEARRKQPDYLAVGIGPGSYTGLRIGVTVARTLAWTWECPLLGINSLTALALAAGRQDRPVVTLLDARQGDVYAAVFRWKAGVPNLIHGPLVGSPDEVRTEIPSQAVFVGDGCARLGVTPVAPGLMPEATAVLALARQRFLSGEQDRIQTVLPLYLRMTEAERKMEAET